MKFNILKISVLVIFFFNLLFLSYELITFNEELFIAVGFFSFFFFLSPILPSLINDFYMEDRTKVYFFFSEEIFHNYNFFRNVFDFFYFYENMREFLFQNLNFYLFFLTTKFFNFYKNFELSSENNDLNLPEVIFLFYDKMITFFLHSLQNAYLDYFNNKWENLLLPEVLDTLQEKDLAESFSNTISDWIYG